MQRVAKQTRKVNRWNAYLHSQVEAFNKDLDPGQPRPKVHEIASCIRERWDSMTEEERIAATEDAVVELEEQRESRQAAKRDSRISTTRDVRTTLDAIEAELQDLYARTGAEILLVSVRSDVENFTTKPRVFTSSPRVSEFFRASTTRTVNDFAVKLQAYCVADIQAPIVSPSLSVQQQILEMKRKVKELINEKLQECARPARMPRINYVDFETCITERHGIVCENWPLPNFCAPGGINSLTELEVLYRAWSTGVTTFRKLSPEEWRQVKDVRTQQRLEAAILQTSLAVANASHSPDVSQTQPEAGPSRLPATDPSASSAAAVLELPPFAAPLPSQPAAQAGPPTQPHASADVTYTQSSHPPSATAPILQYPHNDDALSQPSTSASPPALIASSSTTSASTDLPSPTTPPSSESGTQEYVLVPAEATSTFVFSTGKRPPPSSFNVLGPMSLVQKKPRKKRVDAGIKRGPNKRTTGKQPGEGEASSSADAGEGDAASSPQQVATQLPHPQEGS